MRFFSDGTHIFCAHKPDMPFDFYNGIPETGEILFIIRRGPLAGRETFAIGDSGEMLSVQNEALLSTVERPGIMLAPALEEAVAQGRVRGINLSSPRFSDLLASPALPDKPVVKAAGEALLAELQAAGVDARAAEGADALTGDVLVLALPREGGEALVRTWAQAARDSRYTGRIWLVGPRSGRLAKVLLMASNTDSDGKRDNTGLLPHQLHAFGMGTLARAAEQLAGPKARIYGDDGENLVVSAAPERDDEAGDRLLAEKVLAAGRDSCVQDVAAALRGEWTCSSVYLCGSFMGCRNREAENGQQIERLPLAPGLMDRIRAAAAAME